MPGQACLSGLPGSMARLTGQVVCPSLTIAAMCGHGHGLLCFSSFSYERGKRRGKATRLWWLAKLPSRACLPALPLPAGRCFSLFSYQGRCKVLLLPKLLLPLPVAALFACLPLPAGWPLAMLWKGLATHGKAKHFFKFACRQSVQNVFQEEVATHMWGGKKIMMGQASPPPSLKCTRYRKSCFMSVHNVTAKMPCFAMSASLPPPSPPCLFRW